MSQTFRDRLAGFNQLIQKGEPGKVRAELRLIGRTKPPREELADLSNVARRAGLPTLGLRLLQPLLKAELEHGRILLPKERASYAASLAAIGANEEALTLLKVLEHDTTPEVQLYLSFIYMYRWDYRSAIAHLERYLRLDGLTPYQIFVAKVNLAGALSFEGHAEKLVSLTADLIRDGLTNKWNLLTRDCWLLATQGQIQLQNWPEARSALDHADEFSQRFALDSFLVRKWKALLDLSASPQSSAAIGQVEQFKTEALAANDYESARDCDYHVGMISRDLALLRKVYFGTPFPSYRRRIESKTEAWLALPKTYTWALRGRHGAVVDMLSGENPWAKEPINGVVLNVLRAHSDDFYRPLRMAALFAKLYPGEHFDPVSSPLRVRSAVYRTRQWLQDHGAGLGLQCERDVYSLHAERPVDVRVSLDYAAESSALSQRASDEAQRLRERFSHKAFSTAQAAEFLKVSVPTARGIISGAVASGVVRRIGTGRATLFSFGR